MEIINTPQAPGAIGPYSQGVLSNNLLFISGQLGINPATGALAESVETQTLQVLENIEAIAKAAGLSKTDIMKTTIYLTDLGHFETVNRVYGEFFGQHKPARATLQVSRLPKDGLVEIEAIATSG